MSRAVRTIAWHEYITNVRRKEFIIVTLVMPVMMLLFGGMGAVGSLMAGSASEERANLPVGIVDPGGAVRAERASGVAPGSRSAIPYARLDAGLADLTDGHISALIALDRDYVRSGSAAVYRRRSSIFSPGGSSGLGAMLTRGLLAARDVPPEVLQRAASPFGAEGPRDLVLDSQGRYAPWSPAKAAARFAVPYAFMILLTMAIFFSANYLLRGVADEKENRVIEVILSSVSADDLLLGKLLGLGGVGLTQVGIWFALGAIPAMISFSEYVRLTPGALAGVAVFFVLGYGFYAALMAGVGALGTTQRESQQISGIVSFGAFIPFMFIPALIEFPNGMLARVFSYIPFTAPTTMVLRMTATDVPWVDIGGAAVITAASILGVIRLSARLFRFGLLIHGKRPGLAETLRALRSA